MRWEYFLLFSGAIFVDIVPFPLPPAFTLMIFMQVTYDLNIWMAILVGVTGSIIGRYILTLYIPNLSGKIFNRSKNEDVEFLGEKIKTNGWKGQLFIFVYSLMPLPSTPLFIAGGMAKMKPYYIIPAFAIGKLISDMIAVLSGSYAAENVGDFMHGLVSLEDITAIGLGLLLIFALLFIDWRTLLKQKRIKLKFNIWR